MSERYGQMIRTMQARIDEAGIPPYKHPRSMHTFSMHQLIIMLVPVQYGARTYMASAGFLQVSSGIRMQLGIAAVPHYTTLQKVQARIDLGIPSAMIGLSVSGTSSAGATVGADATGFETRHAAPYHTWRRSPRRAFAKMSAISDTSTQLVGVVTISHHPVGHDVTYFPELFERMSGLADIGTVVLDRGYDAERIHELIRAAGAVSVIPARGGYVPAWRTRGRYRRQTRRDFPEELYGERNKTETVFSAIRRRSGSEAGSGSPGMIEKELLLRVPACNSHRMCAVFWLLFLQISEITILYQKYTSKLGSKWGNFLVINTHRFEAIRGRQAGSDFYIAMCTLKSVSKLFTFKDADIPAEHRAQRTLRKSRIPKIRDYILQNSDDYTFSSVTVSVDGKVHFDPISKSNPHIGTISMSQDAAILINDGQHRVAAIKEAVGDSPELGKDKISVVFFEDLKLRKSQQMFADLNKHAVKPTKSLGILYDRRNDFATFIVDMIKNIAVFYNRIEMEQTSISNRSTKFFTLNGLELATKNLLGKDKNLKDSEKELVITFWNTVAKNIPEWILLTNKKITPADLRKDFVHANTNMLESIAIAGNLLISKYPQEWKRKLAGLQNIDWSRTNPEWEGKIIRGGKMSKTKAGMNKAAKILIKHCGGK